MLEEQLVIEVTGNLWDADTEVICITTNGYVRTDGKAVMGRGCALEATQRFPAVASTLGSLLVEKGNHVHWLGEVDGKILMSFPVKHAWDQPADLALIVRSAQELTNWVDSRNITSITLPRPGCGNGRLSWPVVKAVLFPILDDRFQVITW